MQRRTLTLSSGARAIAALLALVVLLSGCIKYEGTIKIEDDGSGTVDILTAVNPKAFAALGDLADLGGEQEICDDFNADTASGDFPANASVQPYNEDGFCGVRVQFPLAASLDHSGALSDVLDESTRIYKQGDNWFFESNFDANDITGEAAGFGDDLVGDLFGDASFMITIDLPGRAVAGETNATNVGDDGRFTWDIDLLSPPPRLFAQTEPGSGGGAGGGGGGGISPIIIGVVVVALLAVVGFFLYKRKQDSADDGTTDGVAMPQPSPVTGAVATMPVGDWPPMSAGAPVRPDPVSMKETVVMNTGDAADSSTPKPEYDEALGAWIVNDPARGRLRHDPETDSWLPIP